MGVGVAVSAHSKPLLGLIVGEEELIVQFCGESSMGVVVSVQLGPLSWLLGFFVGAEEHNAQF